LGIVVLGASVQKNILVVNKKACQKNDRLLEYFIKRVNAPLS
jgi:hypothetical protein